MSQRSKCGREKKFGDLFLLPSSSSVYVFLDFISWKCGTLDYGLHTMSCCPTQTCPRSRSTSRRMRSMSHPNVRMRTLTSRSRFLNSNLMETGHYRYVFPDWCQLYLVDVDQPSPIALFTSNSIPSFNPPPYQVLACQILPENRELVVILCCGDIVTVSLQDDAPAVCLPKKSWKIALNICRRRIPLDLSTSGFSLLRGAQTIPCWP